MWVYRHAVHFAPPPYNRFLWIALLSRIPVFTFPHRPKNFPYYNSIFNLRPQRSVPHDTISGFRTASPVSNAWISEVHHSSSSLGLLQTQIKINPFPRKKSCFPKHSVNFKTNSVSSDPYNSMTWRQAGRLKCRALDVEILTTENALEFSSAAKEETLEGDRSGQHPTQALLDVYTIEREIGKLDGIKVGLVGDLDNGRTVRSLAYLLAKYNDVKIYFVSPDVVKMKTSYKSTSLPDFLSSVDSIRPPAGRHLPHPASSLPSTLPYSPPTVR
ncbi:hypothetical protein L2E82_48448 [Cichorium intybus]|uniref:Uncharacterized protein n=1 Tax=Cichorium intybus TaxID=13427 RepID=A0ACB8YZ83_CICIN|nr:hypothetical protein L2E82_48448 [Cichorium intybus]